MRCNGPTRLAFGEAVLRDPDVAFRLNVDPEASPELLEEVTA